MLPYGNGTPADQPPYFMENDWATWLSLEQWAEWVLEHYGEDYSLETDEQAYAFDFVDDDSSSNILTLEDLRNGRQQA